MRKLCASVVVLVASALVFVGPATALVTISHTNNTGGATILLGEEFKVFISVDHDGEADLTGIFASAEWDRSVIDLVFAEDAPPLIYLGATGLLAKLSDPDVFPTDPPGTFRTVQFGVTDEVQTAGAGSEFITTLTFEVIGGLRAITFIDVILNSGDGCFGPGGAACGRGITLGSTSVGPPEPSTALLMGLGLAGLAAMKRSG